MSRGTRLALTGGSVVVAVLTVLVVVFGLVGVTRTVPAGTQVRVCGTQLGVNVSGQSVQLLRLTDEALAIGDRVRASPICVIEVLGIEPGASQSDQDGSTAQVQLRWRLW